MDGHPPSLGGSQANPRTVTHHLKDGHPPEGSVLKTGNLYSCPQTQGWSPTNPKMVTHQKEVYYRLVIWHIHFSHKTNTRWQLPWMVTYHPWYGCPPTQGWSPTTPKMVTHQKEVYFRLVIWHIHFSHKTNARWQLQLGLLKKINFLKH